jgi:hypothetical protein
MSKSHRPDPILRLALAALVSFTLAFPRLAVAHDADKFALDFRNAPRDAVLWGTLAKVGVRRENGDLIPTFLAPLPAMEGQRVVLYGYMTARPETRMQKRFLLSPRPIFCGECAPVGPDEIVEVVVDRPVAAADQPVAFRGTLALLRNAPEGLLYRLVNAEVVTSAKSPRRTRSSR